MCSTYLNLRQFMQRENHGNLHFKNVENLSKFNQMNISFPI